MLAADKLLVRPARSGDAEAIVQVHLTARAAAAMPLGIHPDQAVREWLTRRIEVDEVWVAVDADVIVGYVRFTDAWLNDLYISPSCARRGIGSKLLQVVKAQRPAGFSLWVFEMNAPARAFYARHGLVEREHTDGAANEERTPDLRMSWEAPAETQQ